MCETLIGKIIQQKLFAEAKYPDFAKRFMRDSSFLETVKSSLALMRRISDSEKDIGYSVQTTLTEEVLEVFEAAHEERWEDCMTELSQVGSVVLRAMEWIQENKLNKETNNA